MSETRADRLAIVTDLWRSILPVVVPNPYQLRLWLSAHDLATVCYGVRECTAKYQKIGGEMNPDHAIRFASKCMNTRTWDRQPKWGVKANGNPPDARSTSEQGYKHTGRG